MALYFEDWSGATLGSGLPPGWSFRLEAENTNVLDLVEDAASPFGRALRVNYADNPLDALFSFDAVDSDGLRADFDIIVFVRWREDMLNANAYCLYGRAVGDPAPALISDPSRSYYRAEIRVASGSSPLATLRIARREEGVFEQLAVTDSFSDTELYGAAALRFTAVGVDLTCRVYAPGEFTTPHATLLADDALVGAAGWVGFGFRNHAQSGSTSAPSPYRIYGVSIATGGDTAVFDPSGVANNFIDSTTKLQSGKALTVTGTSFSATGNTLRLSPTNDHTDANAVDQTLTGQNETTLTVAEAALPAGSNPGDTLYAFVQDDADEWSSGFAVQVADPALRIDARDGDALIRDIDGAAGITVDPVTVVARTIGEGAAVVYRNAAAALASGVLADMTASAFSIDELDDQLRLDIGWGTAEDPQGAIATATVVDRNDDA